MTSPNRPVPLQSQDLPHQRAATTEETTAPQVSVISPKPSDSHVEQIARLQDYVSGRPELDEKESDGESEPDSPKTRMLTDPHGSRSRLLTAPGDRSSIDEK